MGGSMSRMVGCFAPPDRHHDRPFLPAEPFDEGLGHSFCYVRPVSESETKNKKCIFLAYNEDLQSDIAIAAAAGAGAGAGSCACAHHHRPKWAPLQTSFRTISGASVSANAAAIASLEQLCSFANAADDRAAAFEATTSFSSLPLQPVPRGLSQSGPITGSSSGFLSGPIERGFLSGPLERAFLSGPLERGCVSAPIEATDRSLFSAPLTGSSHYAAYFRKRRRALAHLVKILGFPVKKALCRSLSKPLLKTQRSLAAPVRLLWSLNKDPARDVCSCPLDSGYTSSSSESNGNHNLQWAQGKAGEDRMHVVLSDEHGWLFVGIYDGFSGPDAPDFLLGNLYKEVYKELRGLLWDTKEAPSISQDENLHADCLSKDGFTEQYSQDSDVCQESEQTFSIPALKMAQNKGYVMPAFDTQRAQPNSSSQMAENLSTGHLLTRTEDNFNENTDDGSLSREVCSCGSDYWCMTSNDSSNQVKLQGCSTSQQRQDCEVDSDIISVPSVSKKEGLALFQKERETLFGHPLPDLKLGKYLNDKQVKHHLPKSTYKSEYEIKGRRKQFEQIQHVDSEMQSRNKDIDHFGVLRALSNALESTERMFLEMADCSIEEMPELLLMGSCVLVVLMKGEDVYLMNVGDSRAILAQAKKDSKPYPSIVRDMESSQVLVPESTGLRDTQQRQELERIMEETPSELETLDSSHTCSSGGPAAVSLFLKALQLTTDHSTNIKEEILRIQSEHSDDEKSILNGRVKGRLKVTRAFGAGFLKLPRWNDALLEMFRVDYVGTAPYVTCIPAVHHHRLGPNDRFLVLSSDGLYQYLSNDEVVSQVEWFMENFPDGDPAQYLLEELLFRAAKKAGMDFHQLLDIPQGERRKYHDDVSVMVISLEGRIWRSFG